MPPIDHPEFLLNLLPVWDRLSDLGTSGLGYPTRLYLKLLMKLDHPLDREGDVVRPARLYLLRPIDQATAHLARRPIEAEIEQISRPGSHTDGS